jgi:3-keto-disaccharide hydrolase
MSLRTITALALVALITPTHAAPASRVIPVENGAGLEFVHVVPETVTYKGQKALKLVETSGRFNGDPVALVNDLDFKDGTIEVDLAGLPGAGSDAAARGFVGVAFRTAPHASALECFYLRPTNGRADDQLRRNHSAQYVSDPAFPCQKLRSQTPGVYESYVDLETGAWTHVKIDVSGLRARLFVNGAAQPTLIVNDLKRGATSGAVGLWIGAGTEAYFRNLHVTTN